MKRYHIEYQGQWLWVWAQKIGTQLWFHHKGESQSVEFQPKKSRRENADLGLATGEIKSPMPGKIMKIMNAVGDRVEAGETVVVMEAMKMEYALEADTTGTITSINVKEEEQVGSGVLLAKIDKDKNA